jgi:phosphatidylglycerol:prolipoprotein diacylglycerol transferase
MDGSPIPDCAGERTERHVRPVLFSVFGFDIQSYGVSKALAALVAAWLLARAFEHLGLKRDSAYSLVMWGTIWGFVGAKIYYLIEHLPTLTMHDFGGMGFTWYGGLIGGVVAVLVVVRRHKLPLGIVAGAVAVPLTVAYGIGRLGCLLSGDGTYGRPTSVPWAMTFPNGVVPTTVPVHPTALYEALAAFGIAAVLWALGKRWNPAAVFGAYLALSGISRFLVEFLRINEPAVLGLTQPQLWALASLIAGVVLIVRNRPLNRPRKAAAEASGADGAVTARSDEAVTTRSTS